MWRHCYATLAKRSVSSHHRYSGTPRLQHERIARLVLDIRLNLQPWPIQGLDNFDPSQVSLVSMCAIEGTLTLMFDCDEQKRGVFIFSRVVALRRTAEEALQAFFADFHKKVANPHGSFWIADREGWIASLSPDDWDHRRTARHYVFMSMEEIVEVVSEREPAIVIEDL